MRINSVSGVKYFCNDKNLLRAQSMVLHFVRHPVYCRYFQADFKDGIRTVVSCEEK